MSNKYILDNHISNCTEKTYDNKGHILVLFPGWATDSRIFSKLDLGYTRRKAIETKNEHFFDSLAGELAKKSLKAIMVGWSLGGVQAAHFTAKYPDLVEKAVLVSVKEQYTPNEISKMKEYLARDKEVYLGSFYKRSFSGNPKTDKDWFDAELKSSYIEEMITGKLVSDLDFLKDNPLPIEKLKNCSRKLAFVHGENDSIINADELTPLKEKLFGAKFFVIKNAGHVPFLGDEFKGILEREIW